MKCKCQFSTTDVLRLTVWVAIGCFVSRLLFVDFGLRPQHITHIAVVLALVITPFAAAGAIFDRMGFGILCGMAAVGAIVLFCFGAR
jgi:hypothetical protein